MDRLALPAFLRDLGAQPGAVRTLCVAAVAMAERPTGTVTFLFTDIEGSTRLWDAHPNVMRDALARHDTILLFSRGVPQWRDAVHKLRPHANCQRKSA